MPPWCTWTACRVRGDGCCFHTALLPLRLLPGLARACACAVLGKPMDQQQLPYMSVLGATIKHCAAAAPANATPKPAGHMAVHQFRLSRAGGHARAPADQISNYRAKRGVLIKYVPQFEALMAHYALARVAAVGAPVGLGEEWAGAGIAARVFAADVEPLTGGWMWR